MQPLPPDELFQAIESSVQDLPMAAQIRDDLAYTLYLMTAAKPEWHELFRQHYFTGPDYAELAEELALPYIGIRMKIGRCLEEARSLVS